MITPATRVLVQGITGKEGSRSTKSMLASGTKVVCGVTPGKGGQEIEGLPVYNSVAEALAQHPEINFSVVYVPPLFARSAAMEAMRTGIKTVLIIAENVPVKDTAELIEYARNNEHTLIGPSSVGVLDTDLGKIGSIGSVKEEGMYSPGPIAILSKSGGMCAETASVLTKAGYGQSIVIGIGGDVLIGSTFTDLLSTIEQDGRTTALVLFGEIGGTYEQQLALYLQEKQFSKPVVAFISGKFAEKLDRNLALGHAGAILHKGKNTTEEKKKALKNSGVIIADYHHEIPEKVREALERKNGIQNRH